MIAWLSRRGARALLTAAAWAAPADQREDIHEELGGLIDAAASEGLHGQAILHGLSSFRVVRPHALAADIFAGKRSRHRLTWVIWSGLASVLIATEALVSQDAARQALYRSVTISACLVLIYAGVAAPRGKKLGWLTMAAGIAAFLGGDLLFAIFEPTTFPSVIDASYMAMYPLLAIGVVCIFRAHSSLPLRQSLIPAVVAGGLAFVLWWDATAPVGLGFTTEAKIIAMLYPALDTACLVLVVTMAWRSRPVHPPLVLLALACASLTIADAGYNIALMNGTFGASMWMNRLWLGFYAMTAAAALFPAALSRYNTDRNPGTI